MNFGVMAGGLADGIDAGLDDASKIRAQREAALARAVQGRVGAYWGGGAQPPPPGQPSMPGVPPMGVPPMGAPPPGGPAPGGPPAGGLGALPGASTPGVGVPPGAPPPRMGPVGVDGGIQQTPQRLGPVGPQPDAGMSVPRPQSPPQQVPPNAAQAGMAGNDLQTEVMGYNNAIKSIAADIKKANPNIAPRELFLATEQVIDSMKGVKDEARTYMAGQIELARTQEKLQALQTHLEETIKRLADKDRNTDATNATKEDIESQRSENRLAVEDKRGQYGNQREDIRGRYGNQREDIRGQYGVKRAEIGNEGVHYRADHPSGGAGGGINGALKEEKTLEGTELGKTYKRTQTAGGEIDDLAADPKINSNAASQLGMINRYLYMTTGSTRPPLAEIQKFLGAKDAKDVYEVISRKPGAAPLLGPDQIRRIVQSSHSIRQGAKDRAMKDPVTAAAIKDIERKAAQGSVDGGGTPDYLTEDDAGKAFQRGEISEQQFRAFLARKGHH